MNWHSTMHCADNESAKEIMGEDILKQIARDTYHVDKKQHQR